MRSILNSVPSTTIIVLVVTGTVALAVLGVLAAHKLFPNLADGPFEEMAEGLRVVYELVFALILAFAIASVLDTFSTADSTVASEATTLAHIRRSSQALPIEQHLRLDEGLSQYVHAVVESEWETMRDAKESPRASAALESLYALYQSYSPPPAEGPEAEFYNQAVDELGEATAARRDRLGLSMAELPSLLRLFLPLGAVLLLVLEYRPKMPLRAQLLHIGLLAAVVSFSCLLTVVLDYPFAGDVSVGTDAFKQGALAEFWASDEPHVVARGETEKDLSAQQMVGVWNSDAYGVLLFRQTGDEVRGVYREAQGTVVGRVSPDGVLRGWWCQAPSRQPPDDAGDVEWRLVETSDGETVYGNWRYGTQGPFRGGWDLNRVGGPEPPDLASRFDDAPAFCRHP
ncbi:MAG: DUF4239 domain-containing protein [Actinobacteria bacterium]|nr:DUF4239 domain-containing protein [Actinomycetota bacterium]